jgi:hypothetical protein
MPLPLRGQFEETTGQVWVARDGNDGPEHLVYDEETGELSWQQHSPGAVMTPLLVGARKYSYYADS